MIEEKESTVPVCRLPTILSTEAMDSGRISRGLSPGPGDDAGDEVGACHLRVTAEAGPRRGAIGTGLVHIIGTGLVKAGGGEPQSWANSCVPLLAPAWLAWNGCGDLFKLYDDMMGRSGRYAAPVSVTNHEPAFS